MSEEMTVIKHVVLEKDDHFIHVLTFKQPVFGNNDAILSHSFVTSLVNGSNFYIMPTSDIYTIRLKVHGAPLVDKLRLS